MQGGNIQTKFSFPQGVYNRHDLCNILLTLLPFCLKIRQNDTGTDDDLVSSMGERQSDLHLVFVVAFMCVITVIVPFSTVFS